MAIATVEIDTARILAQIPNAAQRSEPDREGDGTDVVDLDAVRSLALAAMQGRTRILSGNAYSQADAGASIITRYRLKRSAGGVLSDGHAFIENAADAIYAPAGDATVDSYGIDGSDAALLAAAGYSLIARNVFLWEGGVGKEVCIFGAAALTGAQAAPTKAQIRAALAEVFGDDWDGVNGFIAGEVLWQRKKVVNYVAAGTIAPGDVFIITIDGTPYTVTADADDVAVDIADKLRTAIGTNAAGVTRAGAGANVLLTATAAGTTFASSSSATNLATLVGTQADVITETITDPAANANLLGERSAGCLY